MNRDELLSRPLGCPPKIFEDKRVAALYPGEPSGGTWVGGNEQGLCFALVNWYAIWRPVGGEQVSRGIVIPRLLSLLTIDEVRGGIAGMALCDTQPFRLFAVALREKGLCEFRWDAERILELRHTWEPRHWFSSGYDEARANVVRAEVCCTAWRETGAGSLPWLRRLHASHEQKRGPFSICMHRKEAATVSHTEIAVTSAKATMRHIPGSPCKDFACGATYPSARHENEQFILRLDGGTLLSGSLPCGCEDQPHAAVGNGPDLSDP